MQFVKKNILKVTLVFIILCLTIIAGYKIFTYKHTSSTNTQHFQANNSNSQPRVNFNVQGNGDNKYSSNQGQNNGNFGGGMSVSSSSSTRYSPTFIGYSVVFFILFIGALL